MATLTIQNIGRLGVAPGYVAAAGGGDSFTPTDKTFLHVYNNSGGAITVTAVTPASSPLSDLALADVAVSVPAGGNRAVGPFPAQFFADPTDGLADITYSSATSVVIGAFRIAQP